VTFILRLLELCLVNGSLLFLLLLLFPSSSSYCLTLVRTCVWYRWACAA
jgi:hypothetical protein